MLNVAIVGCGNIAPSHLEAYLKLSDRAHIVALCDIFPEKAEKLADQYDLDDVKIFADHETMLNEMDLDVINVCTPPYTHAEISIHALEANCHTICEKPMASSLSECDAMLAAAEASGKLLSIIAQNRFRTPIMKLKQVLDSGIAGKILHATVNSYWWRGHCYYDLWWRGTWEHEGGGCTLNHAVHHIDMLGWMMGLPSSIQAVMSNVSHDNAEVEDLSIAILQYAEGALAQITSSVVHHGEEQYLEFQTEKARLSAPWKLYASTSLSNGFPQRDPETEERIQTFYDALDDVGHVGHLGQIEHVLDCLERNKPLMVDGFEGRRTIEIITAIYKSAITGEQVALPLDAEDPYYQAGTLVQRAPHFYEKTTESYDLNEGGSINLGSDYANEET